MTLNATWFVKDQIIHLEIVGSFTLEEAQENSDQMVRMFEESDAARIHVIIQESEADTVMPSVKKLDSTAGFMHHHKIGWMMIYGTHDRFSKFMISVLSDINRVSHRHCDSLEECVETLVKIDPSLPSAESILQSI